MPLRPIATAGLLAALAVLLYGFGLGATPLTPAETIFNTQAQSIRVGSLPVFFHAQGEHWLQPIAVYANAAVRAAGGGAMSGRIASSIAGAVSVGLIFLIAHLVTRRVWVGIAAALILMLTPAHWDFARTGTDAIFPVPLVLLWLLNTLRFFERDSIRSLAAAAVALGLSVYSHPAAPLTAMFLWPYAMFVARRRNRIRLAIATVVFAATWLPAVVWFGRHFETYPDTFGRWVVLAAHVRNPIDLWSAFINPQTLGIRAALYWGFWDPSWLVFGPQASAPLLWWTAPLIALGAYRCRTKLQDSTAALLFGVALLIPLAGCTFGVPLYIASAAAILPVLALFSGLGGEQIAILLHQAVERAPADAETPGGG
jgi:hypothetical protein